jgi:hypothetical protein
MGKMERVKLACVLYNSEYERTYTTEQSETFVRSNPKHNV